MNEDFLSNIRGGLKQYQAGGKNGYYDAAKYDYDRAKTASDWGNAGGTLLESVIAGAPMAVFPSMAAGGAALSPAGLAAAALMAAIGLGGAALTESEKRRILSGADDAKKRAKYRMEVAPAAKWTDFKNSQFSKATGGKYTVDDLARAGKMINDEGEILDLTDEDYEYYNSLPTETLERVFGKEGSKYIRSRNSTQKESENAAFLDMLRGINEHYGR